MSTPTDAPPAEPPARLAAKARDETRSPLRRAIAWSVHLLTASGAVLGTFALIAIASNRLVAAFLLMLVTQIIDAVDGTLARAARVSVQTPRIDGRRLDDIVDYLNFVIVPVFFMWGTEALIHPAWLAAPVLASAFGFSRQDAKTEDDFFLGFPSYWNVLAMYLWLLGIGAEAATLWVAVLAAAVFVPMKYLWPSKVQPMRLRVALGVGGLLWTAALAACAIWPGTAEAYSLAETSLLYPAWYMGLSITRGGVQGTGR